MQNRRAAIVSVLAAALAPPFAGSAIAQTAARTEAAPVDAPPAAERPRDPFLSSGDEKPFSPPPYEPGAGDERRDLGGGDNFDFDSILAPGQRGNKRSTRRRRIER